MQRSIVILLLWVLCTVRTTAQEQPDYQQLGEQYFLTYRYHKAAPVYERLARSRKAGPLVFYRLGYSYESLGDYGKAIPAYLTCMEKDPAADSLWLRVGDMQKMLQQYDAAKTSYGKYKGRDVTRRIAGCDSALIWQPGPASVTNLAAVNTTLSDWGAFMEKEELIYTSNFNRLNSEGQKISRQTEEPYFRVFRLSRAGATPSHLNINDLASVLDLSSYHIGPACYHADSVYFTVSQQEKMAVEKEGRARVRTRRLELYITDGKGRAYAFPYNDARHFSTGHAALSPDGRVLYFASDRPGGQGGTDIWYCTRDASGNWAPPLNCGPVINTPDDEMFPVVADNGLYIASNGHTGMGGLDVFSVAGAEAQWQEPVNIKPPYNSSYDDFYYVQTNAASGYFSSNRPGGVGGDDIYVFSYQPPAPELPRPTPQPEPVPEKKPEKGTVFVIRNLYYDFDKYNIRPDAALVLDSLVNVLERYPDMRIELSAHTDSRGSDAYNMALSQKRAASAVQYLVSKGIAAGRLVSEGYGESRLVNGCSNGVRCSAAAHQENRRTEVKVL